ncbi:MAG TPA: hypothetical protein VJU87_12095 [Gemmatimonadaceae bacterium]|nr:hypothetical protein [Gemmatimonadaceae bacterium]
MSARITRWAISLLVLLTGCAPHGRTADASTSETLAVRVSRPPAGVAAPESSFARLVAQLSEPGGFFDSDNIISNETSYLQVLDAMRRIGVHGGAYIGVGPDQNFSYMAAVHPKVAFMLDIRRDNLLEHLFYKALFAMAHDRVEFLCLLFGKPMPVRRAAFANASIGTLVAYVDSTASRPESVEDARVAMEHRIRHFGIPLSPADLETIDRIREAFVRDSLGIRFSSLGRAPRPYHPTYRQLLLEHDRAGHEASYLAHEDAFQLVKGMEDRNLVIPVVGNAAGDHAMRAIAALVAQRGEVVSALYISNVEQYLFRDGGFDAFAENVRALPHDGRSVIIRSYFGYGGFGMGGQHPLNVPGYYSTQILQMMNAFVAAYDGGALRSYRDLISRNYVGP